jgi:hypothetical protein
LSQPVQLIACSKIAWKNLPFTRITGPCSTISTQQSRGGARKGAHCEDGAVGNFQDLDDVLLDLVGGGGCQGEQGRPWELCFLPSSACHSECLCRMRNKTCSKSSESGSDVMGQESSPP